MPEKYILCEDGKSFYKSFLHNLPILILLELFRYQLVTEKYVENTLSVANITIFTEGVFCKSLGCPNDPQAMLEMEKFALTLIYDGISVIAVDKKTDKVVGMVLNKILVRN